MTEVSSTIYNAGGKVIGVVPHRILAAGRRSPWCTITNEVNNMNERKQMMKELADCFVCLPGSYGTLDEMFDVIASGTVGEHHKPIYILNYNGFYESIKAHIELMKERTFLPQIESYKPIFVDSLEELKQLI